jgi:cell division protein ZipA
MIHMLRSLWKFLTGRSDKPRPERSYFISTPSESLERLRRLGLATPSEAAPGILDYVGMGAEVGRAPKSEGRQRSDEGPSMGTTGEGRATDNDSPKREYRADPSLQWIIEISWEDNGVFSREELSKVFNKQWRMQHGDAEVYGYGVMEQRWTYVLAGDSPERFDRVEVGILLLKPAGDEEEDQDADETPEPGQEASGSSDADLQRRLESHVRVIEQKLLRYGGKVRSRPQTTMESAVEKAGELRALKAEFQRDVVLVVKSDNFFLGMMAWDALLSLGLQWGDGDLFHWPNPDQDNGDDALFSVWTTSEPGYFFPEGIRAGRYNPEDLVFGYWIARSVYPLQVFDAMIRAAEFCRERLGGRLLDRYGRPFDRVKEREALKDLVQRMTEVGLQPGSERALRVIQ